MSTSANTQATWFVDPLSAVGTASDKNDGLTSSTPLATTRELMRRLDGAILLNNVTITFNSAVPSSDALAGMLRLGPGVTLSLVGKITTVATGTLQGATAVTVQNRATQTPWSVSDNVLSGGIGQYVGKFIQISSGARSGATGRIVKDIGGTNHDARVSPLCIFTSTETVPAETTPVSGDPYAVIDPTTVRVGNLRIESASTDTPLAGVGFLLLNGIRFQGGGGSNSYPNGAITCRFVSVYAKPGCVFDNIQIDTQLAQWTALACGWDNLVGLLQSDHTSGGPIVPAWYACATTFAVFTQLNIKGGQTKFDLDCYIVRGNILVNTQATVEAGLVAFFDCLSNLGLILNPHAIWYSLGLTSPSFLDLIWGTSNSGHAAIVAAAGALVYTTKPTVNAGLGAGREVQIGGVDTLWSGVTNNVAANNAKVVSISNTGSLTMSAFGLGVLHANAAGDLTSSPIVNADVTDGTLNLAKLAQSGATSGQVPTWSGSAWVPGSISGAGGVPSTRQVIAGAGLTGGGALSSDVTLNVVGNADGSIIANANDIQVGVLATDAQHGNRGGGSLHTAVTNSAAGFAPIITAADRVLLSTNGTTSLWGRVDLGSLQVTGSLPTSSLAQNGATTGQALIWNGSSWIPATDFGAQNIVTTGTISSGALTATSIRDTALGTGVVHSNGVGQFTSSLIVNADISAVAGISIAKLTGGANGQVVTTVGANPLWVSYQGDVTGSPGASTVVGLTGTAGVVAVHAFELLFDAGLTPFISQTVSTTNGQILTIQAQSANQSSGNFSGGGLFLQSGLGHGTGVAGNVIIATGSTTGITLSPTAIGLSRASVTFDASVTLPLIGQQVGSNVDGQTFQIQAQHGNGTNRNGGDLFLGAGAKTGTGVAGNVLFAPGGSTTAFMTPTALNFNNSAVINSAALGTPAPVVLQVNGTTIAEFDPDGVVRIRAATLPIAQPSQGIAFYSALGSPTWQGSNSGAQEVSWTSKVVFTVVSGDKTVPGLCSGFLTTVVGGTEVGIPLFALP